MDTPISHRLSLCAVALLLAACPAARQPADPELSREPAAPRAAGLAPRTPQPAPPALGRPPFRLAVAGAGLSAAEGPLIQQLSKLLNRSGVFRAGELAGAASSPGAVLRLSLPSPELLEGVLQLDAAGAPWRRAWQAPGRDQASQLRLLAEELYRFYLDEPGPFFTRIAFVAGTGATHGTHHIFSVNFDGSGIRRISGEQQPNLLPGWSPGGDLIYTAFIDGVPLLLLRDGAGNQRLLGQGRALNTGAAFSPDGQRIAVSQSVDGNTDIFLLDRRGTRSRRLTDSPAVDISPSWSPEGDQLVFVSDREGSPQLYHLTLQSGAVRRLTTSGFYNQEPAWCPRQGSRQLAYTHRYAGGRYEIHLLEVDSAEDTRLTFDGGQNNGPSWGPGCRLILHAASGQGLRVVSPDGQHQQLLYLGPSRAPAWSPPLPAERF